MRVHGHSGKFGVDVSAGCSCGVTGEGLWRRHLVPPAELQGTAAIHLFDLRQVRLCCYHHTWSLAVHEVLLEDFGAVFKGVRVADIIDQADNVTG